MVLCVANAHKGVSESWAALGRGLAGQMEAKEETKKKEKEELRKRRKGIWRANGSEVKEEDQRPKKEKEELRKTRRKVIWLAGWTIYKEEPLRRGMLAQM